MAKAVGARVITTAGTDQKVQECQALRGSSDQLPDGRRRCRSPPLCAPRRQRVVGNLREPNFDRTVGLLALRGRMVLMAGREAHPVFPVGPFYVKDCSLYGFAMFNSSADEHRKCADDINRWMAEGKLKPRIGREFKLADAAAAHKLQEENTLQKSGTLAGKIVLVP